MDESGYFMEWVTKLDTKSSRESRKVLLIVVNCNARDQNIATKMKSIKVLFLLPNCTSRLQPCDIETIKTSEIYVKSACYPNLSGQ